MKIDVLYFEGCPNHKPTVRRVRETLGRLGIEAEVNEVEVTAEDDAAALKFIGSPTVLIDGQDIAPAQRQKAGYGFGCRTFGGAGLPSAEMMENAIRTAGAAATFTKPPPKRGWLSALAALPGAAAEPLNFVIYAHVEIDGEPHARVRTAFRFADRPVEDTPVAGRGHRPPQAAALAPSAGQAAALQALTPQSAR